MEQDLLTLPQHLRSTPIFVEFEGPSGIFCLSFIPVQHKNKIKNQLKRDLLISLIKSRNNVTITQTRLGSQSIHLTTKKALSKVRRVFAAYDFFFCMLIQRRKQTFVICICKCFFSNKQKYWTIPETNSWFYGTYSGLRF